MPFIPLFKQFRLLLIIKLFLVFLLVLLVNTVQAKERYSDPDGCLSCHALEGLEFIDKDGLLRVSTINPNHYYSSLHGSVPCKDCHRKISYYPHKVENGLVDCAESCHINEPSEGVAYTHKPIVEEFEKSAHGQGLSKDFSGGNRLKEELDAQNPSCRRCHNNSLYIAESQIQQFKDEFKHTDTECGTCHQGDAWRNQFGGHILRRLIGSRWKKSGNNKMCIDCHGDTQRMAKVQLEDFNTKEKHPADYRWIHAHESYARSLHNRLLVKDIEQGASCMDCHAPTTMGKFRHNILRDEDKSASTHKNNIAKTCAQSSCHEFATKSINTGFVNTDLHDIDQVKIRDLLSFTDFNQLQSYWQQSIYPLLIFVLIFTAGCISWVIYGFKDKNQKPLIGSNNFEKKIIGTKLKRKIKRKKAVKGKMLIWLQNHRDRKNQNKINSDKQKKETGKPSE